MTGQVRRALAALAAGAAWQRAVQAAAVILLARHLGAAGLGELAFGLQLGALLALLADGGIRAVAAREAAADPERAWGWVRASLGVRLRLAAALLLPYTAAVLLLAGDRTLFLLLCGASALPLACDLKGLADAAGGTRREVLAEGAAATAFLALAAVLVLYGAAGLESLAGAFLASRLLYAAAALRSLPAGPPAAAPLALLREGGPLSAALLLNNLIRSADLVLLRWLAGPAAAGLFHAAQRLAGAAEAPLTLLSRLVRPHLDHAARGGDPAATLERAVRAAAYAVLPTLAGGWVLAEPLLAALFGADYAAAAWTLRWLLLAAALAGTGCHHGNLLFAARRHRAYLLSLGSAMAANLGLTLALIPHYGGTGAAFATAVSLLLGLGLAAGLLRRQGIAATAAPFPRPLAAAAAAALGALAALPLAGVWAAVAAGGLAAGALLWLLEGRRGLKELGAGLERSSGFAASGVKPTNRKYRQRTAAPLPGPGSRAAQPGGLFSIRRSDPAVVVHYRCPEAALACLGSLAAQAPAMPVLVVENGSGDGSAARLAAGLAQFPQARLLRAPENGGFGAGANLGIEAALARDPGLEHVLLLNPDLVLEPGCVAELMAAAARHPDAGVVGGRLLSADGGRVLYANGRLRPCTLTRCHTAPPPGREEFPTTFVTGAMMLLAGDLLRQGLRFDERYFLYVEDLDLCTAVRERGRTLWVNLRAAACHAEGGSQRGEPEVLPGLRRRQLYLLARNKVYYARKRLRTPARWAFLATALLLKPVAGLLLGRGPAYLGPYLRGIRDGLRMRRAGAP